MNLSKADLIPSTIVTGEGYLVGQLNKEYCKSPPSCLAGRFEGVNQFLYYLDTHLPQPAKSKASSDHGTDGRFRFFETYEIAMDTYMKHPASCISLKEFEKLKERPSKGNSIEYGMTGDYLDVGKHLEGEPECFATSINGAVGTRFANIVIGKVYNCSKSRESLQQMNLEIVSLTNWLESNNIRCSIEIWDTDETFQNHIFIKHHNQPLSIIDLAVATHTDFWRRLQFRFIEHSPTWRSGYGSNWEQTEFLREYYNDGNTLSIVLGNEIPSDDTQTITDNFSKMRVEIEKMIEDEVPFNGTMKMFVDDYKPKYFPPR